MAAAYAANPDLSPLRLDLQELYVLIEQTLVDNNAYDVAQSLLYSRGAKLGTDRVSCSTPVRLIRRNGHVERRERYGLRELQPRRLAARVQVEDQQPVAGQITARQIGFDFDDAATQASAIIGDAHQSLPEQLSGDLACRLSEELVAQSCCHAATTADVSGGPEGDRRGHRDWCAIGLRRNLQPGHRRR